MTNAATHANGITGMRIGVINTNAKWMHEACVADMSYMMKNMKTERSNK